MPIKDQFIIQLDKISKRYFIRQGITREVLHQTDLQIVEGDFVTIGGPSGSGKTTILKLLSGHLLPDEGTINLEGITRNEIVHVFQNGVLIPYLSIFENLLVVRNNPEMAEKLMKTFHIESIGLHFPDELSGGEARRSLLAQGMMMEPRLLLIDEPTSNVDRTNAEVILESLIKIWKQGTTIVLVSHSKDILSRGDRRYELREGKLIPV